MKYLVFAPCLSLASCASTGPDGQAQLSPAMQASLERLGTTVIVGLEVAAQNKINEALKVKPQK